MSFANCPTIPTSKENDHGVSSSHSEYVYGGEEKLPPPPVLTPDQERRLWRRVDMRLVPIVTLLFMCSFLDRNNIGNAKLQGLTTQLDLTGERYNVALSMFFIVFNVFSIPASLVFKSLKPSKFLPTITIAWGAIATTMGFVKNYPQLIGVRVCLAVAEAGLACGVFLLFSLWYPRRMLQTRFGIFWAGPACSGAFSGLIAFGISFISRKGGLLGWSWIFIIEGLATVVVGVVSYFILVDLPDTAMFLTPEERAFVIHRKKFDNSSVGEEEHFELRHLREALLDWQIWLSFMMTTSACVAVFGISLFLPSIIHGFGFDAAISQLLTVPVYTIATVIVISCAVLGDHLGLRSPFLFGGLCLCAVGYGINFSDAPIGAKYFGTYLIAMGGFTAIPAGNTWLSCNVGGHYKRAVAFAVSQMSGSCAGIIASFIYRDKDAPRYRFGHAIELVVIGAGLATTFVAVVTYKCINARRDTLLRGVHESGTIHSARDIQRLGDRAPDFRYTL